ncbi:MAG TPA: hypothetical protein VGI10_25415 [Polyangiaceae bacterium]|jgi:hypothetical protein
MASENGKKNDKKKAKARKGGKQPKGEQAAAESTHGFADQIQLAGAGQKLFVQAAVVAGFAFILAVILGNSEGDGWRRFSFSYLTAFVWLLTIGAGALFWVVLQNLVNAKWSVGIRRVGELLASNMPVLAVLALPVAVPLIMGNDVLYSWASKANVDADPVLQHKAAYLNPTFFAIRFVVYFVYWTWLANFYLHKSIDQDSSKGDGSEQAASMRGISGPAMIGFALTLTFCSFDLIMAIAPKWFSTMFGVYYFASCYQAINAVLPLILMWLQRSGRLKTSVTVHHLHDLGKMLFAFTIFWAYIAFSQFMLIWYANVPEETLWFKHRFADSWGTLGWVLLFGHFVIPFFGLLSRHVKRSRKALGFWAIWQLVMIYIDMYWLIMPEESRQYLDVNFKLIDVACWLGVTAVFVAGLAYRARGIDLVPTKDPRLPKALSFENI